MRRFYKTEKHACEAWMATFNEIPGELLSRAYRTTPAGLWLLAGGDRVSVCCGVQTDEGPTAEGVCPYCARPCRLRWGGGGDEWPHAWTAVFHPSAQVDERWIISNADTIARTCHFMVYESDETGVLLAADGDGRDWLADYWLPLFRLRGRSWQRRTPRGPAGPPSRTA